MSNVSARVSARAKERLEQIAEAQGRKVSSLLADVIDAYFYSHAQVGEQVANVYVEPSEMVAEG